MEQFKKVIVFIMVMLKLFPARKKVGHFREGYHLLDENTQKENCSYLKQYKKYLEKVYGKKKYKGIF